MLTILFAFRFILEYLPMVIGFGIAGFITLSVCLALGTGRAINIANNDGNYKPRA